MTSQILFALIAAVAHGGLVLMVLLRRRRSALHWAFLRLELALFVWNLGYFFSWSSPESSFWPRFMFVGVSAIAPSAILFVARLLNWRPPHRAVMGIISMLCCAVFIVWIAVTEWVSPLRGNPLSNEQRDFLVGFTFPIVLYAVGWVAWRSMQTESKALRRHLNYIWIGSLIAVLAGFTDFLQGYGRPFTPLGNLASALYGGILYLAIARSRLLQLRLLFPRVLLVVLCLFLLAGAYRLSARQWGGDVWFPSILSAVLLTLAGFSLLQEQSGLSRTVRRWLGQGPRLEEMIRELDTTLPRCPDLERLSEASVQMFRTFFPLQGIGLYPANSSGPQHFSTATGFPANVSIPPPQDTSPPARPWGREELELLEGMTSTGEARHLLEWMVKYGADWCVPIGSPLRAFLLLRQDYNAEIDSDEFRSLALAFEERFLSTWDALEARSAIERSERLASLGKMAATVAHEIKNPLAAIQASAQYLETEVDRADLKSYLRAIREETDRLSGVVTNFLRYARPQELRKTPCQMSDYVRKVVERLTPDPSVAHLTIVMDIDAEASPVPIDPSQFQQVLINLLLNSAETAKNVRIEGRMTHEFFAIRIMDDGPGIPEEVKSRLFEPFFTTRTRGTGLGLAIAQSIVHAHGGEIRLEPAERGACFVVTLPLG